MKQLAMLLMVLTVIAPWHAAPSWGAAAKKPAKKTAKPPEQAADDPATSFSILSIIPSQGDPGKRVSLMGNGFTPDTVVWLGTVAVPTLVSNPHQVEFEIPKLSPGLYALYLKRSDGSASKTYNFSVLSPKPVITSLTPDTVYSCASERERTVVISGKHFQEGSLVFFDGAAIKTSFVSPESLSFVAPNITGGQHQVQVKNPDDSASITVAFVIDTKPVIHAILQGEERVNSYDLVIEGHNFQQGSTVVVDGRRIFNVGNEREKSAFENCTRIIYERHPYDKSPKTVRIQVVNPSGEESQVMTVTTP